MNKKLNITVSDSARGSEITALGYPALFFTALGYPALYWIRGFALGFGSYACRRSYTYMIDLQRSGLILVRIRISTCVDIL